MIAPAEQVDDVSTSNSISLNSPETPEQEAVRILENEDLALETRRDLLQKLANTNQRSAEIWTAYGQALQDTGDLTTAVRVFERATTLDPSLYTPWYRLGIIAKRGNPEPEYARAAGYFEKALAAGAPEPQALNELAVSQALQGKMREAADTWELAIPRDPDWGVLYSNLIKAALSLGDEALAEKYLPGAIAAERFEESAVLKYGDWLTQRGRPEDAVPIYDKAIGRHPRNANLRFYKGLALEAAGRSEDAVKVLGEARELSLSDEGSDQIAQAVEFEIFRIKNPDAERDFQKAQKMVFSQYENMRDMQKGLLKAVKELDPLLEKHPDFWNGYYVRGVAWRRLNESEKARKDLERVLQLHTDEPNATMELALLHRDQYEFEKAAELADKAVKLAPRDPLFATNAGLIMIEAKRCDRAWELYRNAVRMVGEQNASPLKDQLEIRCAE